MTTTPPNTRPVGIGPRPVPENVTCDPHRWLVAAEACVGA